MTQPGWWRALGSYGLRSSDARYLPEERLMKASCFLVVLWATFLTAASRAVTIDTVLIGNPSNPPDTRYIDIYHPSGLGSVPYAFRMGMTEVTNARYVEFLNAVDPTAANALALYNGMMSSSARGGINLNMGAADGSKFDVKPGRANNPVVFVSWYDAIRFANWLHNGQSSGDTETGAYTLGQSSDLGIPLDGSTISRNPVAKWVLPTEDEWYKAAYHKNDGATGNYQNFSTHANLFLPISIRPPGYRHARTIEHRQLF
jgi:formylglycine-generating enzyme required for sulfatase activity